MISVVLGALGIASFVLYLVRRRARLSRED
jgi:hypothetical protein